MKIKNIKIGLCIVLSFLAISFTYAQEPDDPTTPGGEPSPPGNGIPTERTNLPATTELWSGLYLKFRFTDKLFYYQEVHYRRRSSIDNRTDFTGRMSQVYNRLGITYLANDNFEVTAGPVVVLNYSGDPNDESVDNIALEPRIWHQWVLIQRFGGVKLLHQFRFEHRWKRSNEFNSPFEYTDRMRYKIYAYIPLNKPRMENKTFFLSPSQEIFMHTGREIVDVFEENRIYTAIGYTYNNLQFFGGHMWTYGPSPVPAEYRNRHIIRLNVMWSLDLRRSAPALIR